MPRTPPNRVPKRSTKVTLDLAKLTTPLPRSDGKRSVIVGEEKEQPHPLAVRALGKLAMGFSGIAPLPRTLHTTLKYAEHVLLTGTSGGLGLYVFNASSLYDPNYTGTGHQPRGFDQIMPMYDHFVVLRSRIHAQVTSATAGVIMMSGLALSSTVTNQGDWDDYAEGPKSVVGALPSVIASGGVVPREYRLSYDARNFLGIPDPVTADKLQGTIGGNPTDNAFYHLFIQDAGEATTSTARVLVEIEYDAVFIEPLNPAQS